MMLAVVVVRSKKRIDSAGRTFGISGHVHPHHLAPLFSHSQFNYSLHILLNMLRRKPTAITVTSEDIAAFEEERLHKLENKHPEQGKSSSNANFDPSDELKPLPGDKARIVRSREERIGLGRRG